MVKYEKEEVIFYAVVKKLSTDACLPYEQGKKIIEEFGLPCVNLETYSDITTKESLADVIQKLDQRVSKAPVEELGEGSVVYFEAVDEKAGTSRVLNLCKLKTLDYRYWRKLREKLKTYLGGTKSKESMLKQYEREILELKNEGDYETCYPVKYYIDVAAKSVDLLSPC